MSQQNRFTRYRIPGVVAALFLMIVALALSATDAPGDRAANYHLPSTSQTVYRGFFPRNAPPALIVPSGATVRIDTLSHQGLNSRQSCTPAYGDLRLPAWQSI